MNNRVLMAGVAGGIVSFLLGWLLYGILLVDFTHANAGSATGLEKMPPELWAVGVSNLVGGLLFALLFQRWAGIKTFRAGLIAGAWISFLISLNIDLLLYGTTHMMNLTYTLVDPFFSAVLGGLSGGVVGWVLGMGQPRN